MADGPLALLFWRVVDALDYWLTFALLWLIDLIHGPEAQTPADEKREADHEWLRTAFLFIDRDKTIAIADEGQ